MPNIDWLSPLPPNNVLDLIFHKFIKDQNLHQLNKFATRGSNILDILLVSRPELFKEINKLPPFGQNGCFSDHIPYEFRFQFRSALPNNKHIRNFRKANYGLINSYLSQIDWNQIFAQCTTIDILYQTFCCVIHEVIENLVPITSISPFKPVYPKNIISMMEYRNKLYPYIHFDKIKNKFDKVTQKIDNSVAKFHKNRENKRC